MSWNQSLNVGLNILKELDKGAENPTRYKAEVFRDFIADSVKALSYTEKMTKQHSCYNCAVRHLCKYAPKLGEITRINCFAWEGDE